jgi:hypothetical protein
MPGPPVPNPLADGHTCPHGRSHGDCVVCLSDDAAKAYATTELLAGILTRICSTLKGPPPPNGSHSWHDLPALVSALGGVATAARDYELEQSAANMDTLSRALAAWSGLLLRSTTIPMKVYE